MFPSSTPSASESSETRPAYKRLAAESASLGRLLSHTAGGVPWRRASYGFLATVRSVAARGLQASDALAILEGDVAALRSGALVSDGGFGGGVTTLMNFHQTKRTRS